ncbi:MAG: AI-2E family transporter [Nanobdellota archaeon]
MMMKHTQQFNKNLATLLLIVVLGFLAYAVWPYAKGLLGAFILFVLFKPLYLHLSKKRWCSKVLAATIIIIISFMILIIPFSFAIKSLVDQVGNTLDSKEAIIEGAKNLEEIFADANITGVVNDVLSKASSFISNMLLSAVNNITRMIITWMIMYFVLYYMLINHQFLSEKIKEFVPFNNKNREKLFDEFKRVTTSTVISTGLIALLQGVFLGLGFVIFGIEGALFWGFVGFIFSLLPIVGVPMIWIPTSIYQVFVEQNMLAGFGILIWGSILGFSDYLTRPYLQRKFGEIHPLITLVGVFIGLPIFGILGLILGPLLLSYASLITKMYMEEYVDSD